jgi:hypothetical protein
MLRAADSSRVSGGERRVFTLPARGALAMMTRAQRLWREEIRAGSESAAVRMG